jgi:serine protease Do
MGHMGAGAGPRIPSLRAIAAALAAGSVLLAACTGGVSQLSGRSTATTPGSPLPSANPLATALIQDDPVVQVVKQVTPAVVNITSSTITQDPFGSVQEGKGVGTGFVIRQDGIIVSNFHVVEGSTSLKVTLPPPDGRSFTGRVIGGDSEHDLAVLKIDATGLPTVPLGSSSDLALGEHVIALGYALALPGGPTVTSGIISALARTVEVQDTSQGITRTLQDALQTDAAINPGNSGGPLVDLAGNVVGINTAGNSGAENIGFAIAIDAVTSLIEDAVAHPNQAVPYLGVSAQTVDAGLAAQLGLGVQEGALVVEVAPNGPADEAGIRVSDVIVSLGGTPVTSDDDLGTAIKAHQPGDEVSVEVVRSGGDHQAITVTLGVRPLP